MKTLAIGSIVCLVLCAGCVQTGTAPRDTVWKRIEIDLAQIDENGLRGPADGKVAVAYEFAIPNTDACKAEVQRIDRTVKFMPGSQGRIGATPSQCLCIGSTHQSDYRKILVSLATLPYIDRIIECHFE